jgi:hypothetical protein
VGSGTFDYILIIRPMPSTESRTCFLLAIMLPLAAVAYSPAKPWKTPLRDSIHAYVANGDLRTADSLVCFHAREMLASNVMGDYANATFLFITGNLDSVLTLAANHRLAVHPIFLCDPDLGLVLGYKKEEINRRIDSAFGNTEAAAALKLIMRAMIDFAVEDQMDLPYDPDWFYTWKISPSRQRLNDKVLEHLTRYGISSYDRTLRENVYFLLEKYEMPVVFNILEGGGWMDGMDAGPIWWRSTSFFLEYRLKKEFAYLKFGRAVGGVGLAYFLLNTQRFALSPYAGISKYPFVTLGEYKSTRQYVGPDLGVNLDWKFKIWKPPRALLSLYLRTNSGVVIDPNHFSTDFHRTSFVYLNLGIGFYLDIFAQYIPYVRDGKIKFNRELNW